MTEQFKTEFVYEFKIPFKYACKGEMVDAQKITIKSPNNLIKNFVIKIDEQRLIASKNWQDTKIDIKDTKQETNDIELRELDIIEFIASGGGDLTICFEALKNILKSGNQQTPTALINDETRITSSIFDSFSYIDSKYILGGYIKNFLLSFQQS